MTIALHYNRTFRVERVAEVDGTDKTTFETHIASESGHIQPLEESYTMDEPGSAGKDWLLFCDVLDIKENDRIVDTTDDEEVEYRVVGVESFDFLGSERHMEVRIRKFLQA